LPLVIKTAADIAEPEGESRWAARRAAREAPVLRAVLRRFADAGGPVSAADLGAALPAMAPDEVTRALAALDADDLVVLRGEAIELAYPFSTAPTGFVVRWGGVERFICCAIDALGMAPMLGEPVEVLASCHRSGAPLRFAVTPDGPTPAAAGLMVWVTPAGGGEDRACTGL
jgi:Alkylmercury lyase